MEPLVSIVIPAFNVANYVDECIISLLNQSYRNFEIWVCDDASTDGTQEKLAKYEKNCKIHILYNQFNMGRAQSRNRCIRECNGEYIMMQDADDVSEPERIYMLLSAFEKNVDFVGSGCYCFDKNGSFEICRGAREYPQKEDLIRGISYVHASIMFRKQCLLAVDGYRIGKHTCRGEDYDLILRLYAKGYRGKNIDELLYGYRTNQETYLRRTFRARIDECIIRYEGYKANDILFPIGWIYIFKPIPAYFVQLIKRLKRKRYE